MQWFLSFFLIFFVESKEAHKGAILLLDEAGLTLHPLAQKDLVVFFDNLANQTRLYIPIVPQIEEFARRNNTELEHGWKVSLAKHAKQQLQRREIAVPDEYVTKWVKLFNKFNTT